MIINHKLFANDKTVFVPSAKTLKQLLDICSRFAKLCITLFLMLSNQSASLSILRRPNQSSNLVMHLYLIQTAIKYLGHTVNSALKNDDDITKQTRSFYVKANTIIRKLLHAEPSTKLMLFRWHCTLLYGYQLWSSILYSIVIIYWCNCMLHYVCNDMYFQSLIYEVA